MSLDTELPVSTRLLSENIFNKFSSPLEMESDVKGSGLEKNLSFQLPEAIAPWYPDEDPELTPGKWWERRRQGDLC